MHSRRIDKYCFALVVSLAAGLSAVSQRMTAPVQTQPRMRVIMDNDFAGDPDGLFSLAHLLLSPSVEIRAIIGSHLSAKDGADPSDRQAEHAAEKARALIKLMDVPRDFPVLAGSNRGMTNDTTAVQDEAEKFIIKEALRTDTQLPLYILCGAGLTEEASALLERPEIAGKFTLVWIGGPEYPGIALPPPGRARREYNLNIDPSAVKVVFNRSSVNLWQIPRDAYRQCLVTFSQLLVHVKPKGAIGEYLFDQLAEVANRLHFNGEAYVLGDSPLVLLTALQSYFEADPTSSTYVIQKAPLITDDGQYQANPSGRPIRVYTKIDAQFMFNDFFAKLELLGR